MDKPLCTCSLALFLLDYFEFNTSIPGETPFGTCPMGNINHIYFNLGKCLLVVSPSCYIQDYH